MEDEKLKQTAESIGLRWGTKRLKKLEQIQEMLEGTIMQAEIEDEMNKVLLDKVLEMVEREKNLNT